MTDRAMGYTDAGATSLRHPCFAGGWAPRERARATFAPDPSIPRYAWVPSHRRGFRLTEPGASAIL
jgi:hypothetical protein